MQTETVSKKVKPIVVTKFIVCSLIGIFMFFVTIPYKGKSSIPLDHLTTIIRTILGDSQKYIVLLIMIAGAILPFAKKTWNKSAINIFFTVFKILGVIFGVMYIWRLGPAFLYENPDLFPFLFDTLCCSLVFLIPIGSLFLAFLTDYGLMEFVGVFMQPLMRKIWKTPGRSAVDAVASFVGSYSLALLITDKVYQSGRYTKKEAAIIATGFSTVSATFMIVVARTLGLMDQWNFYFWSTLVITFIVTAIGARVYPITKIPDEYIEGVTPDPEEIIQSGRAKKAVQEALTVSENSGSITHNVLASAKDGGRMISTILPTIMSIGLVGMLLALFTPVFNVLGYIFYPFTLLIQVPEALVTAQALATGIAEMFLPTAFLVGASIQARYIVAVTCISQIIFFSAVVPCILSTKIPLKIRDLVIIWAERVILSIIFAGVVAMIVY
ncbi:MAG: YjiH family protein [Clostridium sp.]|uniref:YjiH family protein n=1 Tax=Clostridium sp. TaxID=1506 RepID=UPI00291010DA|nr:YjiH family protein [Clostridium sp.]MDU7339106.1 YjiH family protein [Clostridium sp.]